jgi:hypothetical protein
MTKTSPARKAKAVKAPAYSVEPFFLAGATASFADANEIGLIKGCPTADVERALAAYVLGYVAAGISKGQPIDAELRKQAQAIVDGVNPEAKTVPDGKLRRSETEHALCRAGARRFNRARAKAGIQAANNSGGARERSTSKPEEKAVTKVEGFTLKAKAVKDMAGTAHKFREGWVNFISANKELDLPEEARALSIEITRKLNLFEQAVSAIKTK